MDKLLYMKKIISHRGFAILLLRFCLGGLFIYTGLYKILHAAKFKDIITKYEILPYWAVNITAVVLPWLEFWTGSLLIIGILVRSCAIIQCALLIIFIAAIGLNILRGLEIPCGCFAEDTSAVIAYSHLAFDTLWLLTAMGLVILERRRFSHRFLTKNNGQKNLRNAQNFIKRFFLHLCIFSFCLYPVNGFSGQVLSLKTGDSFPDILLTGPFSSEDIEYLGFSDKKVFSFSHIKSDFVLVEVFSIYCPVCQTHAHAFNSLYEFIQKDAFAVRNLKMIGIGSGNTIKEVEYFRKYFNVPFPLIADPNFKIHKSLKETRTPLIAMVYKKKKPYVVLAILDFTKKPEVLLKEIHAGLNKFKTNK